MGHQKIFLNYVIQKLLFFLIIWKLLFTFELHIYFLFVFWTFATWKLLFKEKITSELCNTKIKSEFQITESKKVKYNFFILEVYKKMYEGTIRSCPFREPYWWLLWVCFFLHPITGFRKFWSGIWVSGRNLGFANNNFSNSNSFHLHSA